MTLQQILTELGFDDGVPFRYDEAVDMVIFFLNYNGYNPAVTQSGLLVSVGTAPVMVHGRIGDTRVRNPLHLRRDFDLNHPDSLGLICDYLQVVMDKCELKRRVRRCVE